MIGPFAEHHALAAPAHVAPAHTLAAAGSPWGFPLFPERASEHALQVDLIYGGLVLFSLGFVAFIFGLMAFFLFRYRAGSGASRRNPIRRTGLVEFGWIGAALVIGLGLFVWAAVVYFQMSTPPRGITTYSVIGKQWMWEVRHPSGRREINTLHIPVGEPVKLLMSSEDVIHSVYIPAFRTKQDVVPGRYTSMWFTPTKPGRYHLFCAEYCGASHSRMEGWVYVMKPGDYERWLRQTPEDPSPKPDEPSDRTSFKALGCVQCHKPDTASIAPKLEGLFGSQVRLRDGSVVTADEEYIRESIVDPAAKVVAGYQPIMPTYKADLNQEQLLRVVNAVKALGPQADEASPAPPDARP